MNSFNACPTLLRQRGLTLVELITTLAILAVLASVAAPSFTPLFERWQTNQASASLQDALFYARSESIRRGGGLVLIRLTAADNCQAVSDKDWRCGWKLATAADKQTSLRTSSQTYPELAITASAAGDEIHLDRWGGMSLDNTSKSFSFAVHTAEKDESNGKKICIASGGLVRQIAGDSSCSS